MEGLGTQRLLQQRAARPQMGTRQRCSDGADNAMKPQRAGCQQFAQLRAVRLTDPGAATIRQGLEKAPLVPTGKFWYAVVALVGPARMPPQLVGIWPNLAKFDTLTSHRRHSLRRFGENPLTARTGNGPQPSNGPLWVPGGILVVGPNDCFLSNE